MLEIIVNKELGSVTDYDVTNTKTVSLILQMESKVKEEFPDNLVQLDVEGGLKFWVDANGRENCTARYMLGRQT